MIRKLLSSLALVIVSSLVIAQDFIKVERFPHTHPDSAYYLANFITDRPSNEWGLYSNIDGFNNININGDTLLLLENALGPLGLAPIYYHAITSYSDTIASYIRDINPEVTVDILSFPNIRILSIDTSNSIGTIRVTFLNELAVSYAGFTILNTNNDTIFSSIDSNVTTTLPFGEYIFKAYDTNLSYELFSVSFLIGDSQGNTNNPPPVSNEFPLLEINKTMIGDYGVCDARAFAYYRNLTEPVSVYWNNQIGQIVSPELCDGWHTVKVIDSLGVELLDTFEIYRYQPVNFLNTYIRIDSLQGSGSIEYKSLIDTTISNNDTIWLNMFSSSSYDFITLDYSTKKEHEFSNLSPDSLYILTIGRLFNNSFQLVINFNNNRFNDLNFDRDPLNIFPSIYIDYYNNVNQNSCSGQYVIGNSFFNISNYMDTQSVEIEYSRTADNIVNSDLYGRNASLNSFCDDIELHLVGVDRANGVIDDSVFISLYLTPTILSQPYSSPNVDFDYSSINSQTTQSCDGEIAINITKGQAPFEVYLNGVLKTSNTFMNLCQGIHLVRVVDNNGDAKLKRVFVGANEVDTYGPNPSGDLDTLFSAVLNCEIDYNKPADSVNYNSSEDSDNIYIEIDVYQDGVKHTLKDTLPIVDFSTTMVLIGAYCDTIPFRSALKQMNFNYTGEDGVFLNTIEKEVFSFSIYPNPTAGNITITGVENSSIKVLDISGRVIREIHNLEKELLINLDVDSGTYLIRVEKDNGYTSTKYLIKK